MATRGQLVIGHLTPKTANTVTFDFIKYDSVDFFPEASDHFEIQGATEITSAFASDIRLRKVVKKFDGDWPTQIFGVLVLQTRKLARWKRVQNGGRRCRPGGRGRG